MAGHRNLDGEATSRYDVLRGFAGEQLRNLPPGQTLNATALVHEAYVRVAMHSRAEDLSHDEVIRKLSYAIRDVLVSYVRSKMRSKRRETEHLLLNRMVTESCDESMSGEDILRLDEALRRLEECDAQLSEIVVLHVFGDVGLERIGELLGVSHSTVKRRWRVAKGWLYRELCDAVG